MARVKTKKEELANVYDVVMDILFSQPVGIDVEIVFEQRDINFYTGITKDSRRLIIRGDKLHVLSCYDKNPTTLSVDGTIVRDDIAPIPKRGFLSDIENILYYNQSTFEYKEYKDMKTGDIVFFVKKKA
jgi:hypothetical protein